MNAAKAQIKSLKTILGNIRSPQKLDSHPWTESLLVQTAVVRAPELTPKSPGEKLAIAIGKLFPQMMPSRPPRRGLRLDTQWGEFGILAAQYFAPFHFGTPTPTSFRDAWGRIDDAILHFVCQKHNGALTDEEGLRYRLLCNEREAAANSTLSDWHRKGVERLAEVILDYEQHLSIGLSKSSPILQGTHADAAIGISHRTSRLKQSSTTRARVSPGIKRSAIILLSLLGLILGIAGGIKARRIYNLAQKIQTNVRELQNLAVSSPRMDNFQQAGPRLESLQRDLAFLRQETEPFLGLGPLLGWVPVHGGDLAAASDLLDLAENLTVSANEIVQAAQPGFEYLKSGGALDPPQLTQIMIQAQPHFVEARQAFDRARISRDQIDVQHLSPEIRNLIVADLDPVLTLVDDGLSFAASFPRLMGATNEGPKTYLLLIQNEDELRPTGGFISAVGTLIVKDGRVIDLTFEDSYALDDWSRPYPVAPWQLRHYMDIPVLTLHDSNWFADYPTTVQYAEYLYALSRSHSVDGVIALDQHLVVMVLEAIGPVEVEGAPYPITAENVIAYMRSAKIPPPLESRPADWHRKAFINKIAEAVLQRLLEEGNIQWNVLSMALLRALDERHLLLQFDDPAMTRVIARRGWDGAIAPEQDDFLMVVDSNVGYTKSNAVLDTSLSYDVDLTDQSSPRGILAVIQTNNAPEDVPCIPGGELDKFIEDQTYPMDLCYWGYLRVYKMSGTKLLAATPHAIPDSQTFLGSNVPARVDPLHHDEIEKVQAFGTLVLVPAGQSVVTSFEFELPADVLSVGPDSEHLSYRLKVQKQPGTLAVPLTIRLKLPANTTVVSAPEGAARQGNSLVLVTDLRKDVNMEFILAIP
jgi:hypothetical protein